jgi:glycosyltransferase involved in cell wall biosynthesis
VLPLKLFSYLAAGRPILAPAAPDTAELLEDGGNALLVPPGEPEAAAAALDRILGDAKLADRLSAGALASARDLTWDRRAEKIHFFLEERLSRG